MYSIFLSFQIVVLYLAIFVVYTTEQIKKGACESSILSHTGYAGGFL